MISCPCRGSGPGGDNSQKTFELNRPPRIGPGSAIWTIRVLEVPESDNVQGAWPKPCPPNWALLWWFANTTGREPIGLCVLQGRGNLAVREVTTGCPVVLLPGLGDVYSLLLLLGLWCWLRSLRGDDRGAAAERDEQYN